MIALFVTTETREPGPAPIALLGLAERGVERRAASPRAPPRAAFRLTSCTSPSTSPSPYQKSALDPLEQATGRDPGGAAPGRARRCRTPRGAPDSARPSRRCGSGALHAIERRGDDVEVRAAAGLLPAVRVDVAGRHGRALRPRPRGRRGGSATSAPRLRVGERVAPRLAERGAEPARRGAGRGRARIDSRSAKAPRAVAERDRLLDLEVVDDAPAVDAARVLDRHELEEPLELAGAAHLLRLGRAAPRGSPRAPRSILPSGADGVASRRRVTHERRERGRRHRGLARAALRPVRGTDDVPVAGGRARPPRPVSRRSRAIVASTDVRERRAEPAVVRVEQVRAHRRGGPRGTHGAAREAVERERGVGGGAREPGRRAELADEQPATRASRGRRVDAAAVASLVGRAQDGRPRGCPCGREARAGRRPRRRRAPRGRVRRRRPRCRTAGPRGPCSVAARAAATLAAASVRFAEHQRRSPRRRARCARPLLPPTELAGRRASAAASQRLASDDRRGSTPAPARPTGRSSPSAGRRPAPTCPAIAVARSCASRPSTSACCGVNRLPAPLLRAEPRDVARWSESRSRLVCAAWAVSTFAIAGPIRE